MSTKISRHAGLVGTIGSLLIIAILACMLGSCAHPNQPSHPPQSEPIGADTVPRSDTVVVQPARPLDSVLVLPHQSLIDKVFGRQPKAEKMTALGKVGKKSTVSIYYGPATVTTTTVGKKATAATAEGATATVTGKKSGPAVIASDSSVLNAVTGGGNLAAVKGNGNTLDQTSTTQEAADWRAVLAKPAGQVGAAVLGLVVLGGLAYFFVLWRKKKTAENLV